MEAAVILSPGRTVDEEEGSYSGALNPMLR